MSSILALKGKKKKLTSFYIYLVLAGKRKAIRILKQEESQPIWREGLINFFSLLVSFHFDCLLETLISEKEYLLPVTGFHAESLHHLIWRSKNKCVDFVAGLEEAMELSLKIHFLKWLKDGENLL